MSAGDALFVGGVLRELGLPGAIIIVLMGVVSLEAAVIVFMQKHANKVYKYRLSERDVLNKALSDTTHVMQQVLKATEDRNDITEGLADVTQKQAYTFEQVNERIRMQYDVIKDDIARLALVVSAISEAVRNLVSMHDDLKKDLEDHNETLERHIYGPRPIPPRRSRREST